MHESNLAHHLIQAAKRAPDRLAVISPGRALTYGQLDERSRWCAAGLRELGIGRGSRTVLMVRPGPELMILAFALIRIAAVPVLVDPGIGRKFLKRCLDEAAPEAFIGVPVAHLGRLFFGWARRHLKFLVTVGRPKLWGGTRLRTLLERGRHLRGLDLQTVAADDPAAIAFTSGSTGVPKGVVYTHRMFTSQAHLLQHSFQIEEGEIDLATFPLFALFDTVYRATTVFPRMDFTRPGSVDPKEIIGTIKRCGVTHMFGSPALLDRVGRFGATAGVQLPSLRRVLSAGAPVSASILHHFAKLLPEGARIHTPYGATEALPVASISHEEIFSLGGTDKGRGVCVGRVLDGVELEIIRVLDCEVSEWDPELRTEAGAIGEIVVWGDNVSRRYFRRPEADRLSKIKGPGNRIGHRMGDLGYLDEAGRLWFCGRKAHRVQTSDETLFTIPCEGVFNVHPAVRRTALVGLGSPPAQIPVLCVELQSDRKEADRDRLKEELLALGAACPHTRPIRKILFHPGFPVDIRHNAKIFREKLAAWAGEQLK